MRLDGLRVATATVQVDRIGLDEGQIVRRGGLGLSQSLLTTSQRLRRIAQTPLDEGIDRKELHRKEQLYAGRSNSVWPLDPLCRGVVEREPLVAMRLGRCVLAHVERGQGEHPLSVAEMRRVGRAVGELLELFPQPERCPI